MRFHFLLDKNTDETVEKRIIKMMFAWLKTAEVSVDDKSHCDSPNTTQDENMGNTIELVLTNCFQIIDKTSEIAIHHGVWIKEFQTNI